MAATPSEIGSRAEREVAYAFGVHAPELDRSFLVPIAETGVRMCSLRLEPARSGQVRGTRLAADFELRRPG